MAETVFAWKHVDLGCFKVSSRGGVLCKCSKRPEIGKEE
jgi:hypothetical protein